jgi:hypothetical protein
MFYISSQIRNLFCFLSKRWIQARGNTKGADSAVRPGRRRKIDKKRSNAAKRPKQAVQYSHQIERQHGLVHSTHHTVAFDRGEAIFAAKTRLQIGKFQTVFAGQLFQLETARPLFGRREELEQRLAARHVPRDQSNQELPQNVRIR